MAAQHTTDWPDYDHALMADSVRSLRRRWEAARRVSRSRNRFPRLTLRQAARLAFAEYQVVANWLAQASAMNRAY